jgi:Flp pilus assembly protein TadG
MTQPNLRCAQGPLSRFLARCKGLRNDRGQAQVELAVVFAFLGLPILLGTAQMAILVYDSIEVTNAADAGATYGMTTTVHMAASTVIATAARSEAPDFPGTTLTVTSTYYWACSNTIAGPYPITEYTGASGLTNAQKVCPSGVNHPVPFIQVQTSATVTPFVHWPGLARTFTVNGTALQEVQQ